MSLSITLESGATKTKIHEFPTTDPSSDEYLYNPDGLEVAYGFDGEKRYMYGAIDESSDTFAFGGKEYSAGLHNVHLSRALHPGEEVRLIWRNGYRLIIFCDENGVTKVKKPVGGSYQEIGKWASINGNSENTCIKFNDDVKTKRFDYIETINFKEI